MLRIGYKGKDASPRGHVLAEIVETEKSYVDSLRILVKKYMEPLKASDMVDNGLVDEIFFQVSGNATALAAQQIIPSILRHHEQLLDDLQRTVTDDNQCIGHVLLETFRKTTLLDCYSRFVNNWKNAKGSLKMAIASKPLLARFLEAQARQHKGKLSVDSLLIMPIQRIPRYELLVKVNFLKVDEVLTLMKAQNDYHGHYPTESLSLDFPEFQIFYAFWNLKFPRTHKSESFNRHEGHVGVDISFSTISASFQHYYITCHQRQCCEFDSVITKGLKELLKHTEPTHEDHSRLMLALERIKKFAVHIDCASVDPNGSREIEIEGWGSGLGHLVRQDVVTLCSSSNVKKERALFLFADSLVIASIKRKSMRKTPLSKLGFYTTTFRQSSLDPEEMPSELNLGKFMIASEYYVCQPIEDG
ncbi:Rho guanine nucleotide exchange factor 17 [Orchesella cincta]|uniref:Rho guanine nucleotide exchange factor 17 n=1 Tax=Orchesella cincta TaxID=48709 RepID=A0A1D2NMX9_ORCCI|nr:Rho guanine nucleotide exchange factor 17 [Orchesella cincta]